MSTVSVMRKYLEDLIQLITEYAPIINSHMVDYFTRSAYETFVPLSLRNEIENVKYSKAIDFLLYDNSRVDMPCLNEFVTRIKQLTLCNKDLCLTATQLQQKLSEWDCRNRDGLQLKVFMNPKKSHEVEVLSAIAASMKTIGNVTHLVDVGDGKGYLSSLLSLHYKIPVLGIDASAINTEGAIERAEKLKRFWNGIVNDNKSVLPKSERDYTNTSNLLYKQVTQFVTKDTNFKELISKVFIEDCTGIGLVGLHTCGNLAPAALRIFIGNNDIRTLCNVSCCYHLLNEGISDHSSDEYGFPMSKFLINKNYYLGRVARMLSSQSSDRILYDKKLPNKTIFYRAVLEMLLNQYFPNHQPRHVGKFKSSITDFCSYARAALKKLNLKTDLSDEELNQFCNTFVSGENQLYLFNLLRCLLASVIESLILVDRLLYLHECGCTDSYLVQLFNPVISPRCYGITAYKC